jgi:hypothetical protein
MSAFRLYNRKGIKKTDLEISSEALQGGIAVGLVVVEPDVLDEIKVRFEIIELLLGVNLVLATDEVETLPRLM